MTEGLIPKDTSDRGFQLLYIKYMKLRTQKEREREVDWDPVSVNQGERVRIGDKECGNSE